jgi:hypothetical protein
LDERNLQLAKHAISGQFARPSDLPRPDVEYKYIVSVRALEAFPNKVRREGINVPDSAQRLSFMSSKLLNLKEYKADGLIWSYSIIRRKTTEEVIEEA